MKEFLNRIRQSLSRFMVGRHGADELSMYTTLAALILTLVSSITGSLLLDVVGIGLWIWTLFRIFSRQTEKRIAENRLFLQKKTVWVREIKVFFLRLKNFRVYKYFRCPGCKARMRLKRGSGEKEIHCPRCGKDFTMKA